MRQKRVRAAKKGQAAMEFLMTYGWALLAIIIIGGLIWIYIGGRECGRVATGFLGQNIVVEDWVLQTDGSIDASIGNRAPNDVTITDINGVAILAPNGHVIPKGGSDVVECPDTSTGDCILGGLVGAPAAGDCYSEEDLQITYQVTGGTIHNAAGKFSGSYE